jgi:tetratricopeptide (TPR) repeat protein
MRLLVLLFLWTSAFADESRDGAARRHFLAGQEAYGGGRYADAVGEFTAGYALSPRPEFLYNIALAYRKIGRTRDAIDSLQRFLSEAPDSQYAQPARALLGELEPQPSPAPQPVAPVAPKKRADPPEKKTGRLWIVGVVVGAVAIVGIAVGLGVGLAPVHQDYPSTAFPPLKF